LAEAVYEILRQRVRLAESRISYAALAEELREAAEDFLDVTHRSRRLYEALGEVGKECRRLRLPPLPALVVRADTRRPGEAYYAAGGYKGEKISAWRRDLEAVKRAAYPSR
jgi:hypothetical protein